MPRRSRIDVASPGKEAASGAPVSASAPSVSASYCAPASRDPVNNLPVINLAKAGSAIPVKFQLGGNRGFSIFAAGYPKTQAIACDPNAVVDGVEQTVTAGGSSLQYDAGSNMYTYVWKTDGAWSGTCRQLVLKFPNGSTRRADFKFK